MRINILDPGLQHLGGHHPVWSKRLAQSLGTEGHDVCTYGNTRIGAELRKSFECTGDAVPHFSVNPYLHPSAVDPVSGELTLFIEGATVLARELQLLRAADLWLWPTLFPHHLYSVALLSHAPPSAGCIHQQPQFHASYGAAFWRFSYQSILRSKKTFALGVTGPLLRKEYSRVLGSNTIEILPTCHDGYLLGNPRQVLRKVGFFGYQRAEKGTSLISPLIDRLIASGIDVLLHDSSKSLSAAPRRGLEFLGYVDDLRVHVARCDLVIVLQVAENYRVRESGVAMDGIACGIPVVVARGTASEARIKAEGCGGVYDSLTVESVMHTVELCRQQYSELAAAAHAAGSRWSERHGAWRFADSLIHLADTTGASDGIS
jgi:hypothetical protein